MDLYNTFFFTAKDWGLGIGNWIIEIGWIGWESVYLTSLGLIGWKNWPRNLTTKRCTCRGQSQNYLFILPARNTFSLAPLENKVLQGKGPLEELTLPFSPARKTFYVTALELEVVPFTSSHLEPRVPDLRSPGWMGCLTLFSFTARTLGDNVLAQHIHWMPCHVP